MADQPSLSRTAQPSGVELLPSTPLRATSADWPGMRSRWILAPVATGWTDFALSEWELEAASWTDLHHHDELNLVVEGELHVESAGTTVIAGVGDTVRVSAGSLGRYTAPVYARMVAVYGPNPGRADEQFSYTPLASSVDADA